MAVRAILLTEEERAGLLVGLCWMSPIDGQDGMGQGRGEDNRRCRISKFSTENHKPNFLIFA